MLTFGSLFAGFGGMDLGLERAGWQVKWQVENDGYAIRVLRKHWPGVRRHGDVRTFPPRAYEFTHSWRGAPVGPFTPDVKRDITADAWRVDAIVGGDPCQHNSNASSVWQREADIDCGAEFVRVVAALRPLIVLRENPTIESPKAAWPWRRMRGAFRELGYCVLPFRVRACCVGADHKRDRLFLLATVPDANCERLARLNGQGKPAGDVCGVRCNRMSAAWHGLPEPVSHRGRAGIPCYVERATGLGNAVHPDVAEWIGRRIVEATQADQG